MTTDPLQKVLAPDLDMETGLFLCLYHSWLLNCDRPLEAMQRFPLKSVQGSKNETTAPRHEFIIVDMIDRQGPDRKLILERTVCPESDNVSKSTIDMFNNHPDSTKLLEVVKQSIHENPALSLAVGTALAAAPLLMSGLVPTPAVVTALSIPTATAFVRSSLPSDPTLLPVSHLPPSAGMAILRSVTDPITLTMVDALHVVSTTPTGQCVSETLNKPNDLHADDRFLGESKLSNQAYIARVTKTFKPKNLTLYHLALLAEVVHKEYPLYSLFRRQCYWFAIIIFIILQYLDKNPPPESDGLFNEPFDDPFDDGDLDQFYMPFHLYMPEISGRWAGFKISAPSKVVISAIIKKFHVEFKARMAEVLFCSLTDYCLLIS